MELKLLDKKRLDNWLSQFKGTDEDIAKDLIKDITFINQFDYDKYTNDLSIKITEASQSYKYIYLIAITKITKKMEDKITKEPKSDGDIGYNLKKKLRIMKRKIHWELPEERTELKRDSLIIIFDEYIGSGGSVSNSINKITYIDRIKSLVSLKKIQVKVCSIVSYKAAREKLVEKHPYISEFMYQVDGLSFKKSKYADFLKKYTVKKECKESMFGFNNDDFKAIFGSIVIYNSCPNNTPAILWCRQKGMPTPIFSEKKVPLRYFSKYYEEKKKIQYITRTYWSKLKNKNNSIKPEKYYLFTDLMIYIYKISTSESHENYHIWSGLPLERISVITDFGREIGLVNQNRKQLTKDGKILATSIIDSYEEMYAEVIYKSVTKENSLERSDLLLYYPSQIKGIKAT